jgi:hypothetical protein
MCGLGAEECGSNASRTYKIWLYTPWKRLSQCGSIALRVRADGSGETVYTTTISFYSTEYVAPK